MPSRPSVHEERGESTGSTTRTPTVSSRWPSRPGTTGSHARTGRDYSPRKDLLVRTPYLAIVVAGLVWAPGSVRAQSSPTLGGYRLGQTWKSVGGRMMPCHLDAFWPDTVPNEEDCVAPNGVRLSFREGVLIQIFQQTQDPDTSLDHLWHTKWKGRSVRMFGEPDSVRIIEGPPKVPYRGLDARWDRETWCANLSLMLLVDHDGERSDKTGVVVSLFRRPRDPNHLEC